MQIIGNQEQGELQRFLWLVRELGVRRYCEIGCRNGDTFGLVMAEIGPGGYGLAIDLPENTDSRYRLVQTAKTLRANAINVELVFASSHERNTIAKAQKAAPFDLILIDADHRYEGVKKDWDNYGTFADVIAFHDISAPNGHQSDGYPNGVGRFWKEVSAAFAHDEFVTPGSDMGFGILYWAA